MVYFRGLRDLFEKMERQAGNAGSDADGPRAGPDHLWGPADADGPGYLRRPHAGALAHFWVCRPSWIPERFHGHVSVSAHVVIAVRGLRGDSGCAPFFGTWFPARRQRQPPSVSRCTCLPSLRLPRPVNGHSG